MLSLHQGVLLRTLVASVIALQCSAQPSPQQKSGDAIRERMRRHQNSLEPTRQLMLAIKLDDQVAAKSALEQGADLTMTVWDAGIYSSFESVLPTDTSFSLAIRFTRTDTVRLMIERGANVNQQQPDSGGFLTPLNIAIWSKQPAMVALLLARGADPNLGSTPPLQQAIEIEKRPLDARDAALFHQIIEMLKHAGSETYFGPKPAKEMALYNTLSDGSLQALEACSYRVEKVDALFRWTVQGQKSSVNIMAGFWPVFYFRYPSSQDTTQHRFLVIYPLSEKVGRREMVVRNDGSDIRPIIVEGSQASASIYRFEVGPAIGAAGHEYLALVAGTGATGGFCFYYQRN